MRYVVVGTQNLGRHIFNAVRQRADDKIIAFADTFNVGNKLGDFAILPLEQIQNLQFDEIILATQDGTAVDQLRKLGIGPDKLCTNVFWEPSFLQLEPTTKCNLSCAHCSRKDLTPERKDGALSFDAFKKVVEPLSSLQAIQFQGMGEPLACQDLPGMVQYTKGRRITAMLTTNASLLSPEHVLSLLPFITNVAISLDGIDEEAVSRLRPGASWATILRNIFTLLGGRSALGYNVGYNSVVSSDNIDDLEKIFAFTVATRPNALNMAFVENWNVSGQANYDSAVEFIRKSLAVEPVIRQKIVAALPDLKKNSIGAYYRPPARRDGRCWWPLFGVFVTYDGYVTPCCIRMQPEIFNFGNVFESSLLDIWFSERYQQFRSDFFNGESTVVCDGCPNGFIN
jgi:MoaA/NifB/PqqE/SkfB family radical SAM enzyme